MNPGSGFLSFVMADEADLSRSGEGEEYEEEEGAPLAGQEEYDSANRSGHKPTSSASGPEDIYILDELTIEPPPVATDDRQSQQGGEGHQAKAITIDDGSDGVGVSSAQRGLSITSEELLGGPSFPDEAADIHPELEEINYFEDDQTFEVLETAGGEATMREEEGLMEGSKSGSPAKEKCMGGGGGEVNRKLVCMHVMYMYGGVWATNTHAYAYTDMYTHTHTHTHAYIYTCTYACARTHKHIRTDVYNNYDANLKSKHKLNWLYFKAGLLYDVSYISLFNASYATLCSWNRLKFYSSVNSVTYLQEIFAENQIVSLVLKFKIQM